MTTQRISPVTMKILSEGEEVLNFWPTDLGYRIVIKNANGEVSLHSVRLDEQQIPRLDLEPELIITRKDDLHDGPEIQTEINTPDGMIKVTSF
ncbi:hypothetical protein [Spirulina major]|uniref:hypothetical protein n=1 Tax=Spirulina major TaxID=270636 RepID=UPI0011149D89|nr:hypothetical protein [Spirulina major]